MAVSNTNLAFAGRLFVVTKDGLIVKWGFAHVWVLFVLLLFCSSGPVFVSQLLLTEGLVVN